MTEKGVQIDFFKQPPGKNTKYIVKRHTSHLVEMVLKDLQDFSLKIHLKEKSLCQLYAAINCVEEDIKPHTEQILKQIVYKLILDDEPEIASRTHSIAVLLGLYVPTDFILPMIIEHLHDSETKAVPQFISACLTTLSAVVTHSSVNYQSQFSKHIDGLIDLIVNNDFLASENMEVLGRILSLTQNIVHAAGKADCPPRMHRLFKILLQLCSSPSMKHAEKKCNDTLELLAANCELEDSSDLFSIELSIMLDELKEDYDDWDRGTADRFIFDLLVRRSQIAVVDYWETILEIIAANIDSKKDVQVQMDMLALMDHLLAQKSLQETIIFYSEIVLKMILLPAMGWSSGSVSGKIRKAAIICFNRLIEERMMEPEKMYNSFDDIINKLKGVLDDDWNNDLRFASTITMRKFLFFMRDELHKDDHFKYYAEILKRLDDAQDQIRVECCKTLEVFFDVLPEQWSSSLYPYTIKAIFIHIDDPNPAIQEAVQACLKKAARVQTKDFVNEAEDAYNKNSHKVLCKNLLDYATENYAIN